MEYDYWVEWNYIANYGHVRVRAANAAEAGSKVIAGFSDDFRKRGVVRVYSDPPAWSYNW
jgi:hypothetical protein